MPVHVQQASIAGFKDEAHVIDNRRLYRAKFDAMLPLLKGVMDVEHPAGSFYLWPRTPDDDELFARDLLAASGVAVLPGSYLARAVAGHNPGRGRARLSLVAGVEECTEAARRIRQFIEDR
jgi:N-succinyldiaminopimelate aminotransferase